MKETIIGIFYIMTIITTLALCKASSRADKMSQNLSKLSVDAS